MQSPYTWTQLDAVMAAQSSVGVALSAVVLFSSKRSRASSALMHLAIWAAVVMPVAAELLKGVGVTTPATFELDLLHFSAMCAVLSAVVSPPHWVMAAAAIGAAGLYRATELIDQSNQELAALHLVFVGALLGLQWRETAGATGPGRGTVDLSSPTFVLHDLVLAAIAIGAAAFVSTVVLERAVDSADEWAYTYQAALFAKGHAYGEVHRCHRAFQNFWVFWQDGRQFSQYTPGWPLFMAPFVSLRAVWLAGPFSFGLLVAGVARVARRAASAAGARDAAPAGVFAALAMTLSSTLLINGGSRFPHIFVAATFAWTIEATCIVTTPGISTRRQWAWGLVLGAATGLCVATRPPDGALLGIGPFLWLAYSLVRRRLGARAVAGAAIAFAFWSAITLVLLRLQLGKWFVTGYSLTSVFHPWNIIGFSVPRAHELRWSFPLATGSYCWWPCAPALGLAGVLAMPKGARHVSFMLLASCVPLVFFYMMSEIGRNVDFGYGPRYQLVTTVPMAIGGAVLFGAMWRAATRHVAERSALVAGGPIALVIVAAVVGAVRIAPHVYPVNHMDIENRNLVFQAIRRENLHHAVVFIAPGTGMASQLDMTQNMPLGLYRSDNLIVGEYSAEDVTCMKESFPEWGYYRATGRTEIKLTRF